MSSVVEQRRGYATFHGRSTRRPEGDCISIDAKGVYGRRSIGNVTYSRDADARYNHGEGRFCEVAM